MFILGLTGSIGMGKSTTASMFAEEGVPVHDADAAVHRLYQGEIVPLIEAAFPGTTRNGRVDRQRLGARVLEDAAALKKLEAIVHPLVKRTETDFLRKAQEQGADIVVLDIPLLLEGGSEDRCDAIVVVTAPPDIQKLRVFERPGMTEEKFRAILAKQMPDAEKRARADFVVDTGRGVDYARGQVRRILQQIRKRLK
ncbi:MAG: dephospho-CoA kinase [Pseudorhodoplanes sp.]